MSRCSSTRPWPVPLPERDWAELHPDLISRILHRVSQADLRIGGAAGVCRSWRRTAREEPELWRRIDLRGGQTFVPPFRTGDSLPTMVQAALQYSAGQCGAFFGELVGDHTLLMLAQGAPLLKSLHLIKCRVSHRGLAEALKMLPLLEELEISQCTQLLENEAVKLAAGACPRLKHLRVVRIRIYDALSSYYRDWEAFPDDVAFAAASMSKLVSLHLVGLYVDNSDLTAIQDNCHNLEYLNMRDCYPLVANDKLRSKFPRINMDDREYSSDYDCSYLDDCRYYHAYYLTCRPCSPSYPDEYDDDSYDAYDYYTDADYDIDDADLEEHEKILNIKNMRRYLSS